MGREKGQICGGPQVHGQGAIPVGPPGLQIDGEWRMWLVDSRVVHQASQGTSALEQRRNSVWISQIGDQDRVGTAG